jgi:molybdenum cofactor guanylyltransferase
MTPPSLSGLLLAAGHSTRMGRDKALLEFHGQVLWRRQKEVIERAGATEIFLSARPEQTWAAAGDGIDAVLHDALPDCGPVMGITAGLERMSHSHLLVLAVDLPHMEPDWFISLLSDCGPGVGVVGRREDYFEPLAAVYPRELKWLAWETIARGEYSLQHLLAEAEKAGLVVVREISDRKSAWFENWNGGPPPPDGK